MNLFRGCLLWYLCRIAYYRLLARTPIFGMSGLAPRRTVFYNSVVRLSLPPITSPFLPSCIRARMPALSNEQCYANASRLSGRVCLITGAGSGFGRATAVEFAKHGAKLVLGDVDEKGMKETVKQVEKVGG